jgi:hypothetical protein
MQLAHSNTFGMHVLTVFVYAGSILCHAQLHESLCSRGYGEFETTFISGVKVTVGPSRKEKLATRVCSATLSRSNEQMSIVPKAAMVDIDALGIDLGLGSPIVAFQVKDAESDRILSYKIYSLEKSPRLLRTITEGSWFSAADTDLDGQIEIWTDDSKAVDGIDHLLAGELDFAPTLVL